MFLKTDYEIKKGPLVDFLVFQAAEGEVGAILEIQDSAILRNESYLTLSRLASQLRQAEIVCAQAKYTILKNSHEIPGYQTVHDRIKYYWDTFYKVLSSEQADPSIYNEESTRFVNGLKKISPR